MRKLLPPRLSCSAAKPWIIKPGMITFWLALITKKSRYWIIQRQWIPSAESLTFNLLSFGVYPSFERTSLFIFPHHTRGWILSGCERKWRGRSFWSYQDDSRFHQVYCLDSYIITCRVVGLMWMTMAAFQQDLRLFYGISSWALWKLLFSIGGDEKCIWCIYNVDFSYKSNWVAT